MPQSAREPEVLFGFVRKQTPVSGNGPAKIFLEIEGSKEVVELACWLDQIEDGKIRGMPDTTEEFSRAAEGMKNKRVEVEAYFDKTYSGTHQYRPLKISVAKVQQEVAAEAPAGEQPRPKGWSPYDEGPSKGNAITTIAAFQIAYFTKHEDLPSMEVILDFVSGNVQGAQALLDGRINEDSPEDEEGGGEIIGTLRAE